MAASLNKQEHFRAALKISSHPLHQPPVLSAVVATAFRRMELEGPTNLSSWVKQSKVAWAKRVKRCRQRQLELAEGLPHHLQRFARQLQSIAFGERFKELGYWDTAVANGLASGFVQCEFDLSCIVGAVWCE